CSPVIAGLFERPPVDLQPMQPELSLAERRLLLALPRDGSPAPPSRLVSAGFGSETEVLQAAGSPQRHGWVALRETRRTLHALSAEGLRFQKNGLPERRAAEALHRAGGRLPLAELAKAAAL